MGLSQVAFFCNYPTQIKQKSVSNIRKETDYFVDTVHVVHNLLMLCDSPYYYAKYFSQFSANLIAMLYPNMHGTALPIIL